MSPYAPWQEVKDRVTGAQAAALLSLKAARERDKYNCVSCDSSDALHVYEDGARCYSCGWHGSIIDLAAAAWRIEPADACIRLAELHGIDTQQRDEGYTVEQYAAAKSFPSAKLREWGLATAEYKGRPVLAIPYRDADGRVLRRRFRAGSRRWWEGRDLPIHLYGLDHLVDAGPGDPVLVVEGESDCHAAWLGGLRAVGVPGANAWRAEWATHLEGLTPFIWREPDQGGEAFVRSLVGALPDARVIQPNGVKDLAELYARHNGDFAERVAQLIAEAVPIASCTGEEEADSRDGVELEDFWAYMPMHSYIFVPTRELWPASSVNARLPKQGQLNASTWLDRERAAEQMTWSPGDPLIIEDKLIAGGGWIERPGVRCFNLYRAPTIEPGDPGAAGRYLEHLRLLFGDEAEHVLHWLAHRVQRPQEKINHAIALIGPQGTGKDTIVAGVIPAVGPWNVAEVSPEQLMGRFNGFVKSVILRVSEARDLGDTDRYRLYEHLKVYTAAPPDVLRVDEKHLREVSVPNVTGVIITSNHTDGIYLPPDDRRHYVALTELTKDDFTPAYWRRIYGWYEREGYGHVAAYLAGLDISDFDPKAPPPKTPGFWAVVDAGRAPEDAEVSDVLERLDWPDAITLAELALHAEDGFRAWLKDRRNARQVPHRMEGAGYISVRNDGTKDGRWKVGGKNQVIYARRDLAIRDRIAVARSLAERR